MWCITAFTPDNGPLRVIPGSHRVSQPPTDVLAFGSGMGPHPDEVKIVAPAGSVILFNSADLWHSGTLNYSLRRDWRSPQASDQAAHRAEMRGHR
jgi:ectoine hydroxylase-related dioxygenase (phytanoyl-CoA dioxygenase family)